MSCVEVEILIHAPRERVWELVTDPGRLGDWVTIHHKLGKVSAGPMKQDSTLEQTLTLRGMHFHVRWRVVELERPSRLVWEGRGPARSRARTVYDLAEHDDGAATRFSYLNEFKAPLGPLGAAASRALVGGVSEREAHASLERMRKLLEQD